MDKKIKITNPLSSFELHAKFGLFPPKGKRARSTKKKYKKYIIPSRGGRFKDVDRARFIAHVKNHLDLMAERRLIKKEETNGEFVYSRPRQRIPKGRHHLVGFECVDSPSYITHAIKHLDLMAEHRLIKKEEINGESFYSFYPRAPRTLMRKNKKMD